MKVYVKGERGFEGIDIESEELPSIYKGMSYTLFLRRTENDPN